MLSLHARVRCLPVFSRADSFRIPLPADLPPSYTGRAISFTYTLTLGTNRVDHAVPRSAGSNGRFSQKQSSKQEQRSRLIRIPLRIYNHVSVSGATHFFDLTNPVVYRRDESVVREETDEFSGTPTIASPPGVRGPRRDSAAERSRAKAQGREEGERRRSSFHNRVESNSDQRSACRAFWQSLASRNLKSTRAICCALREGTKRLWKRKTRRRMWRQRSPQQLSQRETSCRLPIQQLPRRA